MSSIDNHDDNDNADYDEKLLEAAKEGNCDMLQNVIEAGADVNSRNQHRKTPCMLAAQNGHVNCVNMLIEAGADVNARGIYDKTALILAAETGETACVQRLIEAGADVDEGATLGKIRGKTALMYAADRGHLQCTKLLIEAGADVNMHAKHNFTASMFAARHGHDSCVKTLVEAGGDVNETDNHGHTALMLLFEKNDRILWLDLNTISDERKRSTVKLLLKLGAHVNNIDAFGQNALISHMYNSIPVDRYLETILFAAGETTDQFYDRNLLRSPIPKCLQVEELKLCLKHLTREAIRKYLLRLNRHANLFLRVPQLGLPSLLTEYLLYEMSLE